MGLYLQLVSLVKLKDLGEVGTRHFALPPSQTMSI